jgi:cytidine deaminase
MAAPEDMIARAKDVLKNSYSPYSHFSVACCLRDENGHLHSGCNIENASYGLTLCAETAALSGLVSSGNKKITEALILISGKEVCAPCGRCRQVILEFANKDTRIHLCTLEGRYASYTIDELIPHAFSRQSWETT